MSWPSTSWPAEEVPSGCTESGGWLLRMSAETLWSHIQKKGPMKAKAAMRSSTNRLIIAGRCRTNRWTMVCSWVRSAADRCAALPGAVVVDVPLLIADPRVEHAVQQVGDEVGQDDHEAAQQQPSHQRVGVVVLHGGDEEVSET